MLHREREQRVEGDSQRRTHHARLRASWAAVCAIRDVGASSSTRRRPAPRSPARRARQRRSLRPPGASVSNTGMGPAGPSNPPGIERELAHAVMGMACAPVLERDAERGAAARLHAAGVREPCPDLERLRGGLGQAKASRAAAKLRRSSNGRPHHRGAKQLREGLECTGDLSRGACRCQAAARLGLRRGHSPASRAGHEPAQSGGGAGRRAQSVHARGRPGRARGARARARPAWSRRPPPHARALALQVRGHASPCWWIAVTAAWVTETVVRTVASLRSSTSCLLGCCAVTGPFVRTNQRHDLPLRCRSIQKTSNRGSVARDEGALARERRAAFVVEGEGHAAGDPSVRPRSAGCHRQHGR